MQNDEHGDSPFSRSALSLHRSALIMTGVVHLALPQFQSLLVILARIGGILAAFPVLGSRAIPARIKAGFMLVLGSALLPIVRVPTPPGDPLLLGAGLTAEFLVGLVLGLGVRAVFAGIELAGELMGNQMGLGMVQLLDPMASHQVPLISNFQAVLASLVFVSLNAHFMVVRTVASSFDLVTPFGAGLSPSLAEDVIRISQGLFVLALKLAAPVMVVILLINLMMTILGRTVSQLNVFILGHPLTIAAGFLVMGAALPFSVGLYESEFIRLEETIEGLMRMLGHG
jgi:flagellar biosynthetic protein FliR